MECLRLGTLPAMVIADGVPPQRSSTMRRCKLESRPRESRIDAALEAIARIGIDAEPAPGLRNVAGRP